MYLIIIQQLLKALIFPKSNSCNFNTFICYKIKQDVSILRLSKQQTTIEVVAFILLDLKKNYIPDLGPILLDRITYVGKWLLTINRGQIWVRSTKNEICLWTRETLRTRQNSNKSLLISFKNNILNYHSFSNLLLFFSL